MNRWRVYPNYKPSGVDWLGEIPRHWEVRRLKFVASQITTKLDQKPADKIYLGLENVESGTGRLLLNSPTETVESVVTVFQNGDVLFGKLRPYLAKVVLADFDGVCTSELMVLRPLRYLADERFLFYLMLSHGFISIVDSMTYGAKMPRANPNQIGNLAVSLPPLPEQHAIAAYLDRETVRLDALIARKRKLLDLLERQRAAIISHAITKGLNPAAPLKDSGIPWLGEIPGHWEVTKVKKLAGNSKDVVQTGPFGAQLHSSDYVQDGIPLILIKNVKDYFIDDSDIPKVSLEDANRLAMYRLETGDIVFSRVGSIGRMALVTEREKGWLISGQMLRLRLKRDNLDSKYLLYALSSEPVLQAVALESVGSTRESINTEILRNLEFPLPPLPEQRAIAEYLDRETARIDRLKGEIEASIELLQRYRAALISAAVTGKIDVRGA